MEPHLDDAEKHGRRMLCDRSYSSASMEPHLDDAEKPQEPESLALIDFRGSVARIDRKYGFSAAALINPTNSKITITPSQ